MRRTPPASVAGPLELVEFWILELLALASRIVFAISFDTIDTVTVYLVVVSTIIIFEELLFVKLLGFLGLLVFGDVPDATMLAGSAIVVASGLYTLYRERVAGKHRIAAESTGPAMEPDGI